MQFRDHTARLFGGNIVVLFYDVTTLYFEADYEDELRKTRPGMLQSMGSQRVRPN